MYGSWPGDCTKPEPINPETQAEFSCKVLRGAAADLPRKDFPLDRQGGAACGLGVRGFRG